ncbi:MAG: SH3 domain-containing protein [Candidatus Dormibacteria bacterium]
MPQFESVEFLRQVGPGQVATLIPSWNTGYPLRSEPGAASLATGTVRPGQRLHVLEARDRELRVEQEAEGLTGWIPAYVVAPWPEG